MTDGSFSGWELRSTISAEGTLTLKLEQVRVAPPQSDEVIIRVQAAPLNPSDIALLLEGADMATLTEAGTADSPRLNAAVLPARLPSLKPRHGLSMPVGNEGAGTVVSAGANVRHLLGRVVGAMGGGMYTQYRCLPAASCVAVPDGTAAHAAASLFINPLTALAMVEVMKREGHRALAHTAAASNLGQMLNRVCLADGIPLVNVVRGPAAVALLRSQGALHVLDSESPDFHDELTEAMAQTGATLAFDAVGGGSLANSLLRSMESALNRGAATYSRYGSPTHKQIYIYGGLGVTPTVLDRSYGMAWGVSTFLVTPFLARLGQQGVNLMHERIVRELGSTFASHYTETLSLRDVLKPETAKAVARRATGAKYLIDPSLNSYA